MKSLSDAYELVEEICQILKGAPVGSSRKSMRSLRKALMTSTTIMRNSLRTSMNPYMKSSRKSLGKLIQCLRDVWGVPMGILEEIHVTLKCCLQSP